MASARARLGTAVSVALAAALVPGLLSPAAAMVPQDTAAPVVLVGAPLAVPAQASLASATTVVATVPAARYALPASRTGKVILTAAAKVDPVVRGKAAVATAKRFAGIPYRAGGTSPATGFDCSGYTRYVYSRLGIALPRVSRDQYAWGVKISRSKAVPGDLVFFYNSSGRIYHVAIYAGGGYIWHSPYPGKRVMLEKIWTSSWKVARVRV